MNKKIAAAVSGGAVLVALAGCSSDDGNGDKLNAWAKDVCDAVQPQAKRIEAANAAIQKQTSDNSTPADVKSTDSQAFKDMSEAYKAIGDAVAKAGAPDVDNGKTKQQNAVKELNSISTSYGGLQKQVSELDIKDQAKFAEGLKGIATQLDKLSQSGNDALKKLEEGDVGKAMAEQKSCQSATTEPTSTG